MKLRVQHGHQRDGPRVDPAGDETGDDENDPPDRVVANAVERMIIPTFVRYRFMSIRIRAITGIAEIDIAVARKSAKHRLRDPRGDQLVREQQAQAEPGEE